MPGMFPPQNIRFRPALLMQALKQQIQIISADIYAGVPGVIDLGFAASLSRNVLRLYDQADGPDFEARLLLVVDKAIDDLDAMPGQQGIVDQFVRFKDGLGLVVPMLVG